MSRNGGPGNLEGQEPRGKTMSKNGGDKNATKPESLSATESCERLERIVFDLPTAVRVLRGHFEFADRYESEVHEFIEQATGTTLWGPDGLIVQKKPELGQMRIALAALQERLIEMFDRFFQEAEDYDREKYGSALAELKLGAATAPRAA